MTASDMKRNIVSLGTHGKGILLRSIRHKLRRNKGISDVAGIAFSMERHGIFLEKGAGRSYGGKKKNGRQGTNLRPRREWLYQTIDANAAALAESLSNSVADQIEANTKGALVNFKVK